MSITKAQATIDLRANVRSKRPNKTLKLNFVGRRKNAGYPSVVARLVYQARKEAKFSLNALAIKGFSKSLIWQIENTKRSVLGPDKLCELADILGISRMDIIIGYLIDNINKGSAILNLKRVPFASAKLIFLLAVLRGLSFVQLAKKVGICQNKIYRFINGNYLINKKELDALLICLDVGKDDSRIIRKAWSREHEVILEKERKKRIRMYEELIEGFPMEELSFREKRFIWFHIRQGWDFAKIGRNESLSRERVRQIVKKTLAEIAQWKEGQER